MKQLGIYSAAILSMLFWSSAFVWSKIALQYYSPITIVLLRLIIASILMEWIARVFVKERKIKIEHRYHFILLSFFEPFCYFIGEYFGMQYVSATIGALVISTIPVFTPFVAYLLLKEKITKYGIFGLFLSFGGVVLIVLQDSDWQTSLKGIALLFFAVFSGLSYGFLLRKIAANYSSILIVKVQSQIGALMFLPLFLLFDVSHFLSVRPDVLIIGTIVKLAVFASCGAFLLFTIAMRHMGLTNANLFTNLIPVFTAFISYIVLNEAFSMQKIVGVVIVIFGLFISQIPFLLLKMKPKAQVVVNS
jgi:drug/metabolite transporter (DMT)-like permease